MFFVYLVDVLLVFHVLYCKGNNYLLKGNFYVIICMVLNVKNVCILKVYVLLYNVRILYIFSAFFQ